MRLVSAKIGPSQTYIPDLPPPANRPSAIKGPLAFTPADGELFRKLGRETELRKLLGYIQDDQIQLVVLMGASGAGKTSLLRAGLTNILKDTNIKYHYWEAVPSESGRGLLMAIQQSWDINPDDDSPSDLNQSTPKLKSLDELVNSLPELGRHVVVMDQFEQLGEAANSAVFRLLRKVIREAKPPHRVTWVIAFRREFRAKWSDFIIPEHERGFFPPELSLRQFTPEQAHSVISQLLHAADMSVEQKVINNLIEDATVEGEISSVDLSIGLLVLSELQERQGARILTLDRYHFGGGAEGLLTQYINRCLDIFPDEDQKVLLNALLALRDASTNQRIAEGKTCEMLATELEVSNIQRLTIQLERLAQRDIRLLEQVMLSKDEHSRYRLPHERLIPALNRLAGKLIGEMEEAKVKFDSAFLAWKNNPYARYLVSGSVLRFISLHKAKIQWGNEEAEKLYFLKLSERQDFIMKFLTGAGIIVFLVFGVFLFWDTRSMHSLMRNYPAELTKYQHNLKVLELTDTFDDLDDFELSNSDLEELNIKMSSRIDTTNGLAKKLSRCPKIKKLAISFLSVDQDYDLSLLPTTITALSLEFNFYKNIKLPPLSSTLTSLSLGIYDSKVEELPALPSTLTSLSLRLNKTEVKELPPLPNSLTSLTLVLTNDEIKELPPLPNTLTNLTLVLTGSQIKELPPLPDNLTSLSLAIHYNQMEKLPPLPNSLKKLTLDLGGGELLPPLPDNLTELAISSSRSQVKMPPSFPNALTKLSLTLYEGLELPRLPANLTDLTLNLADLSEMKELPPLPSTLTALSLSLNNRNNKMEKLPPLSTSIKTLSLDLSDSKIKELPPLPNSITMLSFDLGYSLIRELPMLPNSLTDLTLNLNSNKIKQLPPLPNTLTELYLRLSYSQIEKLPLWPNSLTVLSLDLGFSPVKELPPLPSSIITLSLDLRASNMNELPSFTHLNCQRLSLKLDRDQRMSLQEIPKSVTNLSF